MNGYLGNCGHVQISAEPTLALWIVTEQNDDFCPISVKIQLKDKFFLLPLPDGEAHYVGTNNNRYLAFNTDGEFW